MNNNPLIMQQILDNLQRISATGGITPGQALQNNLNNILVTNPYYSGIEFAPNVNNVLIPQVPKGMLPSDDQARYINQQNKLLESVDDSIKKNGVIPQNVDLRNVIL